MANSVMINKNRFAVGDTVSLNYKFKEGEKERTQLFKGVLVKITGNSELTRSITIRKVSKSGIGIERIIPLSSPNIVSISVSRQSTYRKAKLYFIRELSESETRNKLYSSK